LLDLIRLKILRYREGVNTRLRLVRKFISLIHSLRFKILWSIPVENRDVLVHITDLLFFGIDRQGLFKDSAESFQSISI
jgi:hypothetical protein